MTLYTTTAGAFDFGIMMAVVLLAVALGSLSVKRLGCAAIACYAFNRLSLSFGDPVISVASQSIAEAVLMVIVVRWVKGTLARGFAGLFLVDLVIYAAFLHGLIGFDAMANGSLVTFYFQLLILLAGAVHGTLVSGRSSGGHNILDGDYPALPFRFPAFRHHKRTQFSSRNAVDVS